MPTPPTRLLVLRHGESEWNVLGRWQGSADPPLTELGGRQSAEAAQLLGTFDAVVSSDQHRASATALILCNLLGVGPPILDARWRETGVGQWEGLTHEQIEAGWPGYLATHRRPDGAEDAEHVVARVTAGMLDIAAEFPAGEVLVVSHAGVLRALRRSLGEPDERFANLAGCWFAIEADGTIRAEHPVSLMTTVAPISDAL